MILGCHCINDNTQSVCGREQVLCACFAPCRQPYDFHLLPSYVTVYFRAARPVNNSVFTKQHILQTAHGID